MIRIRSPELGRIGMITVTYDRATLYAEVWKEPISVVAKRYGVSDVALHKICRKLKVPVPGRGYWARIRSGAALKITPLPKYSGPQQITVNRPSSLETQKTKTEIDELGFLDEDVRQKLLEVCANISIPSELIDPSPLVIETQKALMQAAVPAFEILRGKRFKVLDISVCKSSLIRALSIMDALIKSLESLGFNVHIDPSNRSTFVKIFGEKVNIKLTEHQKRVEHVLTPEELKKKQKGQYFYAPTHDIMGDGKLTLTIDSYLIDRRSWKDGKTKLENRLGTFVIALVKAAKVIKDYYEKLRIEEEIRIKEQERRLEQKRLREEEIKKFNALKQKALDWHEAQIIRNYASEVEKHALKESGDGIICDEKLLQWLSWARSKADWLDPLVAKEDPILGRHHEDDSDANDLTDFSAD